MKQRPITTEDIISIKLEKVDIPVFEEKELRGKDYVNYGEKNLYPQYLLSLLDSSVKHNAIVKGKVDYVVGSGVDVETVGNTEDKAKALLVLEYISGFEDINDQLYKVAYDLEVFNGVALEVIPSVGGSKPTVSHIDWSKLRLSPDKKKLFYSEKWEAYQQSEEKTGYKELKIFDEKTRSGVLYYTDYRPGIKYYPKPNYVAAINYIEIDKRISNFHLNNLANGFSAGTLISFNTGVPSKEEQANTDRKIKRKFSGDDNAGEIIVTFAADQSHAPQVLTLQSNNFGELFKSLNETAQQEIYAGHLVTSPMLFGIKTEGQLGGRTELRDSHELFMRQYVDGRQKIIQGLYNYIFKLYGLGMKIKLLPKETISSQLSEGQMDKVLTINEIREIGGYDPIKEEQTKTQMSSEEDPILTKFSSIGVSVNDYEIVSEGPLVGDSQSAKLSEVSYIRTKFLSDVENRILSLIKENNKIGVSELANAVKLPLGDTMDIVQKLSDQELISGKVGFEIKLTPKGEKSIDTKSLETVIEVKYRYELKDNAPALVKGGESRKFCQRLIALNKLYTREEIDSISNDQGEDAWRYRGGWYHNPQTDVNVPSCRHTWKQVLVRRKNG